MNGFDVTLMADMSITSSEIDRLRELWSAFRKILDVSQKDAGILIGKSEDVAQSYVSDFEKGRNPRDHETILAIQRQVYEWSRQIGNRRPAFVGLMRDVGTAQASEPLPDFMADVGSMTQRLLEAIRSARKQGNSDAEDRAHKILDTIDEVKGMWSNLRKDYVKLMAEIEDHPKLKPKPLPPPRKPPRDEIDF